MMKTSWTYLILALGLVLTASVCGQTAKEIVKIAGEKARGNTSIAGMITTTIRPKWTRSMDLRVWTKGNDFALTLAPAKGQGTSF